MKIKKVLHKFMRVFHNIVISIVIFNKRFINYTDPNAHSHEHLLNITFLNRGFGGGEVRLSHAHSEALELRHGDWIMLSANSEIGSYFRWYRILNVSPAGVQKGAATRRVTLQGADWELPNANTQVTIMEGVIGVFEKKIRLDHSSLW